MNLKPRCHKKNSFFLIAIILFCFNSCKKNDPIIGKWDDNIKLSQKSVKFSSAGDSITISTESKSWWFSAITFNKQTLDLKNYNLTDPNLIILQDEFKIQRKNGNDIIISMSANKGNAERTLNIGLQSGDYFDGINVVQTK